MFSNLEHACNILWWFLSPYLLLLGFHIYYLFFFPVYPCISFIPFVLFCETVILELLVQQWIWNYPLEPGWLPMGIWLKTMTASVSGFVKRHSFNLTSIHDWQLATSFFFIVLVRWVAIWYHDCNGYICPKWQHFIAFLHII